MLHISINEMMRAFNVLESQGCRASLLGIGPMSKPVIEAALELAEEKDFPVMFIASRNQIDSDEFGRGYVCNWNQADFVNAVRDIAKKINFGGLYYICRDHGGPWQRDRERSGKLSASEAMEIAKRSFLADLKAGFDLLHIDPTKDPHAKDIVPMESVLERTVELIEYVEKERKKLDLPEVAYEVGTEETNGGLTSEETYSDFIKRLVQMLSEKNLPLPLYIVGQTGTLTRLTENVGRFNPQFARKLSDIAKSYGVGLKEHNGDYLSDDILLMHPGLGITAVNVAPEYGVAETAAYLTLAEVERKYYDLGMVDDASLFVKTLRDETIRNERWRKWLVGDDALKPVDEVIKNSEMADTIMRVGGHYSFDIPAVEKEKTKLFDNLSSCGLNPQQLVIDSIKRSIGRYVECFGLEGLTAGILRVLK